MGAEMAAAAITPSGVPSPNSQDLIGAQRVADQDDPRPVQFFRQLREHGPQILRSAGMVLLDTEGP